MQFKYTAKRALLLLLSLIFVFCTAFGTTSTGYAASTSELRSRKDKIQQQINQSEKKIAELAKEKKETQEYITELDRKIQLLQDKIDVLQADADDLQASIDKIEEKIQSTIDEINKTQAEIDKKQAEFDKVFDDYCQRLRAMYISGHASNLEVLLTSSDISSILTRSQMIKSVSKKDSKTLDDLMTRMEEIEKDKAALEKKQIELGKNKKKLVEDKKKLTDSINVISSAKSELSSEIAEANALIRKLNSQTSEYQETIAENQEQLAKVEAEIRAAYNSASHGTGTISGSSGDGSHSGTLAYPTSYHSISGGYPNYSSGRYHGGVDFPCPIGTPVHASESGTVIVAKNLNYSYGHYLIIDHGNGLSTLYGHNSQLLVGVGDHVSRGQTIAYSGSTGNSSGPHVHFEVRVNGDRRNPFNYL